MWHEVLPPSVVPEDPAATALGLVRGLRLARINKSFRCGNCQDWIQDSALVWVPNAVKLGDKSETITEIARLESYNGNSTGWCLPCARKLGKGWIKRFISNLINPWRK